MPGIWQALLRLRHALLAGHEVAAALRDIDILQQQYVRRSRRDGVLLVPTLDERARRETEPHTPSPRARLQRW